MNPGELVNLIALDLERCADNQYPVSVSKRSKCAQEIEKNLLATLEL